MLLAFDNTDGPEGGCTTHATFHVLLALPELALTGMPRLVRLNPNIPWKTRGNAAVALPLGHAQGPQVRVGELRGREVLAFPEGPPAQPSEDVLERAWQALQRASQPDAKPAVALLRERPPQAAYWQAVQTLVDPDEARQALDGPWRSHPSNVALPGCLGAAAWPGPPSSYEFLAYRHPSNWRLERRLDPAPLQALDGRGTFHTWDPAAQRLACVPHTPDPVLVGLRGRDPDRLRDVATRAVAASAREPVDGWLLFATNQASGDHLVDVDALAQAPVYASVRLAATVTGIPEGRHGGHVFVALRSGAGEDFQAVAFEPTKGFRQVVRALRPGDAVEVAGALESGLVKLERLRVAAMAVHAARKPPLCPSCGRTQKSAGAGQALRCKACKTSSPAEAAWVPEARPDITGWHEVPIVARRHLHRPLEFDAA